MEIQTLELLIKGEVEAVVMQEVLLQLDGVALLQSCAESFCIAYEQELFSQPVIFVSQRLHALTIIMS